MGSRSGFLTGDDIAQSINQGVAGQLAAREAQADLEQSQELVSRIRQANATIETLYDYNAGNLAEKNALRKALAAVNPDHPLLTNAMLREQLHNAATRVFHINKNWDDVARYGQNFRY